MQQMHCRGTISAAYRAPCLSLNVRHTLTLFLKCAVLYSAEIQGLWRFSREYAVYFAELRRVWQKGPQYRIPRLPHKSRDKP